MTRKRRWQQEIERGDDCISTLHLWRSDIPDVRYYHWFSTRIIDQVSALNWHEYGKGYAVSRLPGGSKTRLHWLAVGKTEGQGHARNVDHLNGNPRDSRDSNLYDGTHHENLQNPNNISKSDLGSYIYPHHSGRYVVQVKFNGSRIYGPVFQILEQAQRCATEYTAITNAVDYGLRSVPAVAELKAIANNFRTPAIRKDLKLSDDQVREIRSRAVLGTPRKQGGNIRELAEEFNVSPRYVRRIVSGTKRGGVD